MTGSTFECTAPSVVPQLVILGAAAGHLIDEERLTIQRPQCFQTLPSVSPGCVVSRVDVDNL